ncbi:hypothetical protein MC885_019011 [Smutsia gigantea]|nr:hypothetical protein MC885_019011 [Smutsia gigantea]
MYPSPFATRRFWSHDDCKLRGRAGDACGPSRDPRVARWELACLPPPQRVLRARTHGFLVPARSLTRSVMAGHQVKPDTRNCKRPRELEPQMPDSPQLSSLGKSDSSFSESSGLFYKDETLEKDLNAVDASYIDKIDGLFREANAIENFLIQKRELLRQRFTVIANTLHN